MTEKFDPIAQTKPVPLTKSSYGKLPSQYQDILLANIAQRDGTTVKVVAKKMAFGGKKAAPFAKGGGRVKPQDTASKRAAAMAALRAKKSS